MAFCCPAPILAPAPVLVLVTVYGWIVEVQGMLSDLAVFEGGAFHPRRPFLGTMAPCLATNFSINSRSTTVMSVPWAAVMALKLLWRSEGMLTFTRLTPDSAGFAI